MTLNDETFVECASALADRMKAAGESTRDQIKFGFLIATCREPTEFELDELVELGEKGSDPESKFRAVAVVLLNLDEVLMK